MVLLTKTSPLGYWQDLHIGNFVTDSQQMYLSKKLYTVRHDVKHTENYILGLHTL